MLAKKKIQQQDIKTPSISYLIDNINKLNYNMTIKMSLVESIKQLYYKHYNKELNINIKDSYIIIEADEDIKNTSVSIRFVHNFKYIIKKTDTIIQTQKQNEKLRPYIGQILIGKIISIGNNKTCIINILDTNLLMSHTVFFKGDTFIVDKQYSFLVINQDDNILLVRNHPQFIMSKLKTYYTEYNAQQLKKIYRKVDYINYIIVDTEPSMLHYFVQRYLDNIEHINEDIGYEKIKFFSGLEPIEHIYLNILHITHYNRNKHFLGFQIDNYVYYVTDKLLLNREIKKLDTMIQEIYEVDQIEIIFLNLHSSSEEIAQLISNKIQINKFNIHILLKQLNNIVQLTDIRINQLVDEMQWQIEEATKFMQFIINFYLYNYSEEINISKYIIQNNNSILNCLNNNI